MEKKPKISVIVPVYNVEAYLAECLDSICNQTLDDIEIICVNDGSTDNSSKILKKYADIDKRIQVYTQNNHGLSAARNTGVSHACGDYLYFCDSDDFLELDAMEILYAKVESCHAEVVFFDAVPLACSSNLQERARRQEDYLRRVYDYPDVYTGKELMRQMLAHGEYVVSAWLSLVKRDFYVSSQLSFQIGVLHEDISYTFKLFYYSSRACYVHRQLYNYRVRDNSIAQYEKESWQSVYGYFAELCEILRVVADEDRTTGYEAMLEQYLHDNVAYMRDIYQGLTAQEQRKYKQMPLPERRLFEDMFDPVGEIHAPLASEGNFVALSLQKDGYAPEEYKRAFEERSARKRRPHTMLRFEVQLAEHCNLNCRGCSHYAPVAEPEFLDLAEYERDLARLSELFDRECRWVHLMGGEPLLHPEVAQVIRLTRKYFPWGQIVLVTNGVLLGKMKKDFWAACRECHIVISATKYPVNCDYEAAGRKAKEEKVKFEFYSGDCLKTLSRLPLSLAGNEQASESFVRCFSSNECLALRHGRIYGCDAATYAHHLIKKFNLPIHESKRDSIDIYEAKSAEEIMEHCAKPIPFCRYCSIGAQMGGEPFRGSGKDRYEWLDFEGHETDWDYLRQFRMIYVCTDAGQHGAGGRLLEECQERGLTVKLLDVSTAIGELYYYGEDVAFLLCYGDKAARREAERVLWAENASHMIPVYLPPNGGQS